MQRSPRGLAPTAQAQDIPRKSITMLVGFAPGGGADTAARLIAKKLSENLGLSVVVENRAGAGGNIAHDQVARAEPDGSTILLGSIGPLAIAPHLMKLPYDPVKDLAPITMGVNFPNVLVTHAGLGIKTLGEYIALAKKDPSRLSYASTGAGSASHLAGELLNQRAGIDVVHVPYKGGAPAMVDLVAGRVASYYSTPSSAQPHIETGKITAIATTGLKRPAFMPDIPTIAESGIPGFNATNWYAFVGPAKTPAKILDRWNEEIVKVLKDPDVAGQLIKHGLTPDPMTREELAKFIASESATWGAIIKERGIKVQ
ncbi:tripartite tricarboxylate transporter substrate binding protein [Pigmentiphaga sp.]|uniref:Bug family tripartite tricarboxylate transporter substrate binding protein n=1 Tax=Pigmentiphaga sp. TaxID=1977564 RepID=UPI0025F2FA62|nr:tripartite tricarboxylate transporter substrate binding protein [Pigmentiphaga sp.]